MFISTKRIKYIKNIRKVTIIILLLIIAFSYGSKTFAADNLHWYLKRIKGSKPQFPPEAETIEQYGAYYIDKKASMITPVPGGVGPMTITTLLKNTLLAAKLQIKDHI